MPEESGLQGLNPNLNQSGFGAIYSKKEKILLTKHKQLSKESSRSTKIIRIYNEKSAKKAIAF